MLEVHPHKFEKKMYSVFPKYTKITSNNQNIFSNFSYHNWTFKWIFFSDDTTSLTPFPPFIRSMLPLIRDEQLYHRNKGQPHTFHSDQPHTKKKESKNNLKAAWKLQVFNHNSVVCYCGISHSTSNISFRLPAGTFFILRETLAEHT